MINYEFKFISTQIGRTASASVREGLIASCRKKSAALSDSLFLETMEYSHKRLSHRHILDDLSPITESYFKFCFVRNPWDRCVSQYLFRRRRAYLGAKHGKLWKFDAYRETNFRQYIKTNTDKFKVAPSFSSGTLNKIYLSKDPFVPQVDWISNKSGEILMDFVGRFENLQEDFNTVCDSVGVPRQQLPYIHRNLSRNWRYAKYYDDEARQIVAEKYAKDIECFGYEFDARQGRRNCN